VGIFAVTTGTTFTEAVDDGGGVVWPVYVTVATLLNEVVTSGDEQ
jgi:hypothetical protein